VGDFFFTPSEGPLPPEEPDIPIPDFETIANGIGTGWAKSGIGNSFFAGLVDALFKVITLALGLLLTSLIKIFAKVVQILGDATVDAQGSYGLLVAGTLKDLFGIDVNPADVNTRQSGPSRQAVANKLGQSIIGVMFSGSQPVDTGGITPSANAADSFLATVMNMELNGWLESWVTDGLSGHVLEKYGDLKDGIARSLGLGRLARQVFAPPLKVLVHDPYQQLLDMKYRPRVWNVSDAIARFNRGSMSRNDLTSMLGIQGYTEAQIEELILQHQKNYALNEIAYMQERGILIGSAATAALVNIGYTDGAADALSTLFHDQRLQKYRDEMVTVAEGGYVAGNLSLAQFTSIAQNSGWTAEEQQWMVQVAQLKRQVKVRHLSEGEIIKGIEDGVLNFNDLKDWATRENMPITEEAFLELEVQFQENKQAAMAKAKAATAAAKVQAANAKLQAAQQKAAAAKQTANLAGLTPVQAATLVKDHIWTTAQYTSFLTSRGIGPDAVQANLELLQAEMNAAAAKQGAAGATRASAAAKGLNLAQMEKAVIEGLVTEDKLHAYLVGEGYSSDDAQIIVDLTHNALTAAQQKAAVKSAAKDTAATKGISLPDLERAVRLGLTPIDNYTAALRKARFDEGSITLLTGILQSEVASDKAAAAKRAASANAQTVHGVTLAQLEQEVISGIRPISDYTAALLKLGYSQDDQQQLTQLLQLRVDQAKATGAKRDAAAAALQQRGISLADAERAVKLGIVPIATYQQLLRSLHYTPDAIDVLSASLLAEVAATKKAQASVPAATAAVAAKSISLPDLQRAVIAGVRPIDDYSAALKAAGYGAGDIDTLTQLLQLKVDQAARAEQLHTDAIGTATERGLNLAQEEAAVLAGDIGMGDYDAFLINLGYDEVDRGILEALLQAKIDAKAAKDASAGNGGTAGA